MNRQRVTVMLLALILGGCATSGDRAGVGVDARVGAAKPSLQASISFTTQDRTIIRKYYKPKGKKGLPPGLAKKEQLPPGLRKQLVKNGHLPPGLEKKTAPLPVVLEKKLSPLPSPYIRVRIGGDILLFNQKTRVIVDMVEGI